MSESDFEKFYEQEYDGIGNPKVFAKKIWQACERKLLAARVSGLELDDKRIQQFCMEYGGCSMEYALPLILKRYRDSLKLIPPTDAEIERLLPNESQLKELIRDEVIQGYGSIRDACNWWPEHDAKYEAVISRSIEQALESTACRIKEHLRKRIGGE